MHDSSSPAPREESRLIIARFFWRFTCTVDDEPVPWLRRMDRRVFQYLLLTPDGHATRDELQEVFWPDQDANASKLSLRTACSNIRKALGALLGTQETADYFASLNETLSVNLELINVDVRRYIAHVRSANTAYATDDFKTALVHFRRAIAIYRGHIGWGDERETWLEPLANECADLQRSAIERFAELSRKSGAAPKTDTMLSPEGDGIA
ncbi:MAG: AfsR/SARP family transcriptional regulator [Vulcanimicrobiaceae bacterium]